jgi:hypothetical protein
VQGSSPDELPAPAEILAAIGRAMRIEGADHGYGDVATKQSHP